MHVEPHHPPDQLAALIRTEPRAKVARRLAAVRLALLGQAAPAVAAQVLLSDRQVRTWVARYNRGGVVALADQPGRGRRGPLSAEQEARLRDRLRAGPTAADGGCALRGEDVRRILQAEFGVLRSLQAVYDLLHRLGFGSLRPRPRHLQGDPQEQEAFKKNSPGGSPRSPPPTPARGSSCGSRMRPLRPAGHADAGLGRARHAADGAQAGGLRQPARADGRLPGDKERARLRRQALDWLRANLAHWTMQADGASSKAREAVQQQMRHWQTDAGEVGVRDKEALAKLPVEEQEAWLKLWDDVSAVLKRASEPR
jgi:transposase